MDAERSILGAILMHPESMVQVAHVLDVNDFYNPTHADVWRVMQGLYAKREPIDLVLVNDALREKHIEPSITAGLMDTYVGTKNITAHANLIKGARKKRDVIEAASQIAMIAQSDADAEEVVASVKELILSAVGDSAEEESEVHLSPQRQAEIIMEMFRDLKSGTSDAISTGIRSLDDLLDGGLHRDELVIVAARTSVGKSAFAENVLEGVAANGGRVLNVQLEMSPRQVLQRYLIRGNVPRDVIKGRRAPYEAEERRIDELIQQRERWAIHLLNKPGSSAVHIHSEASRLMLMEGQLDLVVIDYLQLMGDVDENKMVTSIAKVTKRMKTMAREFHVPVILISQLNRNVEHRGGKPQLHDLAHSSAIENDADVALLLWDTPDKPDASGNITHMYVAKNRQGPRNVEVPIHYVGEWFRFTDASGSQHGSNQSSERTDSEAGEAAEIDLEDLTPEEVDGWESAPEGGEEV